MLALSAVAQAATPRAALNVRYWPHGFAQASVNWTLRCGPAGGTHPARRTSCSALATHAADLGPATRACTILSPPTAAKATISGTWAGRRVNRSYRIGCPGWADLRIVLTGK